MKEKIEQVAANPIIFNNKKIVPGIAVKSRKRIIENLEKILNSNEYTEEIEKLGINKGTYDWINSILNENLRSKIKSTIIVKDLAMLLQANNKMQKFITENRDKLSTSIDEFEEKIKFAITELSSKTKYFSNKRNATYQIFINHEQDKDYGNNCPGEIISLRNIYENDVENKIVSEERKTKYIGYCDQLLEYLKNEAYKTYSSRNELDSKINSVSSSLENILDSNQEIAPYSSVNMENRFDQSLNDLLDKIKLVKEARVNEEKFEIIIEKDQNDKKRD